MTSELIERVAECIFEAMRWAVKNANTTQGKPPTWFPNGNSFAQDEARRAARAALEASSQRIKELEGEVERLREGLVEWLEAVGPEQVICARRKARALLQPKEQQSCQVCGATDPKANEYCSGGFHAPNGTYWPKEQQS